MSVDSGSAFTLFIESGLHAGTVQRLAPGIYTLGSELEADIILSDNDIKAVHLLVELDRRGMRLEPLQGSIAINGESVSLEPGDERHLTSPASFAIGGTTIKITAPKDAVQARRRMRAAVVAAGIAVLAVLGFQVFGSSQSADGPALALMQKPASEADGSINDAPSHRNADTTPEEMAETQGPDESTRTAPDVSLDQAAAALRERLAADDLTDIEVRTADDRIMVRGEAEPARMGDWQSIRIWFDGAFGQDLLLVANVEPAEKATPPKLAIEAVWAGDDPYLVAGGRRFFVGAHIGDGWTIGRIGSDEITFKRGGKSFSLTL